MIEPIKPAERAFIGLRRNGAQLEHVVFHGKGKQVLPARAAWEEVERINRVDIIV